MSNTVTWLHLSDLHFCKPKTGWDAARVLESLRTDLQKMESEHGLQPDFIFFTGDVAFGQITNSEPGWGITEQFAEAEIFFEGVRSAFTNIIPKSNFFIVPGNHDVNRDYIDVTQTSWLDAQQSVEEINTVINNGSLQWRRCAERLQDYSDFLQKHEYEHLLLDKSRSIYSILHKKNNIKIGIAGFNSAWSCGKENEKGKIWMAGRWQIENLLPNIKSADLKIALLHHPPNWLITHEDPTFRHAIERDFDFCLHGHEHQEWVEQNNKHIKVAAGACYASSDSENAYNFVHLDLSKGTAEVWLRRYDHRGGGWVPDNIANKTDNDGVWRLSGLNQIDSNQEKIVSSTNDISSKDNNPKSENPEARPALPILSDSPPVVSVWVGRDDELNSLKTMQSGVVAITGIGGQGKSSLVAKYLETINKKNQNLFWDWRDCREQNERFHSQFVALIERFTEGVVTGEKLAGVDTKHLVKHFFANYTQRPGIFVLDNVDHYVNVEDQRFTLGLGEFVDEALNKEHNFLIILTCRPRVTYPSARFQELHLSGLNYPETLQIFQSRKVKMGDRNVQEQIKEIWRRTEGHAFWLDLIATQMERSPSKASNIVEELRKGQSDDRALAMFKALWKGLHQHQQTVLRYMAEMKYSETKDSIRCFTSATIVASKHFNKAFNGLLTLSLLVERKVDGLESQYDLHPLVKSFINKEFSSKQERQPFILQILRYITNLHTGNFQPTDDSPQEDIDRWAYKAELELENNQPLAAIETLENIASQLVERGFHEELFRIGLSAFNKLNWHRSEVQDSVQFNSIVSTIIVLLAEHEREAEARQYLELYHKITPSGTAAFINFCDTACSLEWTLGNFAIAIDWGTQGVEFKERSRIDTKYDASHNLALSLRDQGKLDEALEIFAPQQKIEDILSDDHLKSGKYSSFYGNVGRCLQFKNKVEEAIICYVKSAELLYKEINILPPKNLGYACLWIAEALESLKDLENAYIFYKNANNIWDKRAPIKALETQEKIKNIQHLVNSKWHIESEYNIDFQCQRWIAERLKDR